MDSTAAVIVGALFVFVLVYFAAVWSATIITVSTTQPPSRWGKLHRFLLRQTTVGEAKVLHADLVALCRQLDELVQNERLTVWVRALEFFSQTAGWETRCKALAVKMPPKLGNLRWTTLTLASCFALTGNTGENSVNQARYGSSVSLDSIFIGGKDGIPLQPASYWEVEGSWKGTEAKVQMRTHLAALLSRLRTEVESLGKHTLIRGDSVGQQPLTCDKR